ncbi:GtrA family protein [Pinirhizobacter sp.]|jgi:putative flippase GtrA|uniref:GtrA family protein n=1 Tax=Pinirhizobacter sp. TaxID=2950432 RepID=UPI002F3E7098
MTRLRQELVGFAAGGLLGLAIDASIVQVLVTWAGWHVYPARAVSFAFAATFTWWWSRHVTFRHRHSGRALHAEWLGWVVLMSLGAAVNLGIYVLVLKLFPALVRWPAVAVAAGSAAGAAFNFASARGALFTKPKSSP